MVDESPRTETTITDPLFANADTKPSLIVRRELLEVGHVPDQNRIVGRDAEIDKVASELEPVVRNEPPSSFIIYGKTGTGKSLVSRSVASRARDAAAQNGVSVGVVYVDCSQYSTETQVTSAIGRGLNEPDDSGFSIPRVGISRSHYYDYLWETLETLYDAAIIILDEVDQLVNNEDSEGGVLMQLTRAKEMGKIQTDVGIIAISNKINYRKSLNERVKSSLGDDELVFSPYNGDQLRSIMEGRKDAFRDGALDSAVIPKAAALAAREHGDARRAIRILRNAGDIASETGSEQVLVRHVDRAQKRAEADRLNDLLAGMPPHSKYILLGLANLDTRADTKNEFRTTEVYDAYTSVCETEGTDSLGLDRVRDLLGELSFLEITESDKTGGGRGRGSFTLHTLMNSPEAVFKMVDK
ncbi:MAG: Cdc6/Cdc18 family protein [Halohasta sp.]